MEFALDLTMDAGTLSDLDPLLGLAIPPKPFVCGHNKTIRKLPCAGLIAHGVTLTEQFRRADPDELTVLDGGIVEWVPRKDRAALIATLLEKGFVSAEGSPGGIRDDSDRTTLHVRSS